MSIGHHISRAWTSALYNSGIRLYRGCVDLRHMLQPLGKLIDAFQLTLCGKIYAAQIQA